MNSAKLITVIVTDSVRGKGTERDPSRRILEYWDVDGKKLAEDDPWAEQVLEKTQSRLARLHDAAALSNTGDREARESLAALLILFRDNPL